MGGHLCKAFCCFLKPFSLEMPLFCSSTVEVYRLCIHSKICLICYRCQLSTGRLLMCLPQQKYPMTTNSYKIPCTGLHTQSFLCLQIEGSQHGTLSQPRRARAASASCRAWGPLMCVMRSRKHLITRCWQAVMVYAALLWSFCHMDKSAKWLDRMVK